MAINFCFSLNVCEQPVPVVYPYYFAVRVRAQLPIFVVHQHPEPEEYHR